MLTTSYKYTMYAHLCDAGTSYTLNVFRHYFVWWSGAFGAAECVTEKLAHSTEPFGGISAPPCGNICAKRQATFTHRDRASKHTSGVYRCREHHQPPPPPENGASRAFRLLMRLYDDGMHANGTTIADERRQGTY